ncbi:movement protein [Sesamum angolense]|uniref:Movement protein n=1 Tax=Sesamum angolense TaxID=2727404 RepID=A0AAE1X2Z5_9LAMI|nr:movement protein [Sesamum angolense]
MDLQPSQNNYNEGDRLQTSESLSGFFSRMTVSNKTMERIMRQDSNLSPYDGFRIEGSLIPKEEILEELSRLREEIAVTMKWIHIGTIEVVIKATFKEGIDSKIHLPIMDRRINNLRDGCLGTMIGNLYAGKLMFDIHPRIAYNLADQDFSRALTLHQDFKRKDLMKEGNRLYSITYRIAYALFNTHHSDLFLKKEYIEIPRIFKEFAKVMTPDPIRKPRIGGVDIVIKDHPVLDRTISFMTEFSSRMSFSEDRIMGYKGKEKDLLKALTPQEIRASQRGDFDAKLTHPKMQDKRKFGKVLLSFRQQGLIDSDSFYKESKKEIENLKETLEKLKTMDISEESKLSLENVKRLIQRNFSENLWHGGIGIRSKLLLRFKEECKYDSPGFLVRNHGIELQEHIVEKIRNFPDILKDKKHLQSFLGVVNFAGIFIKDLAKYRKDFRLLLNETESAKWKWEEIHAQRVRELKQVCNNLPKLAIPQDKDELVVYTDANDYRWAAVLMKNTTTGEEPCRYIGGLFTTTKPSVAHQRERVLCGLEGF